MSRDPLFVISKKTFGIDFNPLLDAEEYAYVFNINKSLDSYDFLGMATIPWLPGTPSIVPPSNPCPEKCCDGKKIQMVPVWNCTRKFGGTIEFGPIKHGYICCDAANFNCFGIQKYRKQCMSDCIASGKKTKECKKKCFSKKGNPIDPEIDPTGSCEMKCVTPKEKATACNSPTMPWDYSIPQKHHCYAWADYVTTTKCK